MNNTYKRKTIMPDTLRRKTWWTIAGFLHESDIFNGDPMLRQIMEGVAIRREGRNAMNNKTEWNTIKIPRANIELM